MIPWIWPIWARSLNLTLLRYSSCRVGGGKQWHVLLYDWLKLSFFHWLPAQYTQLQPLISVKKFETNRVDPPTPSPSIALPTVIVSTLLLIPYWLSHTYLLAEKYSAAMKTRASQLTVIVHGLLLKQTLKTCDIRAH